MIIKLVGEDDIAEFEDDRQFDNMSPIPIIECEGRHFTYEDTDGVSWIAFRETEVISFSTGG